MSIQGSLPSNGGVCTTSDKRTKRFPLNTRVLLVDVSAFVVYFFLSALISDVISSHIGRDFQISFIDRATVAAPLLIMAIAIFYDKEHYNRQKPTWMIAKEVSATFLFVLIVDGFLSYAAKSEFSRLWVTTEWGLSILIHPLVRSLTRSWCGRSRRWPVEAVLVGAGETAIDALYAIASDPGITYEVKQVVPVGGDDIDEFLRQVPPKYASLSVAFPEDFQRAVARKNTLVILAPDHFGALDEIGVTEALDRTRVLYCLVPPISDIPIAGMRADYFFGRDVLMLWPKDGRGRPIESFIKRTVDILLAGGLILALSPLLAALALLVAADGAWPLFGHVRLGRHGKPFRCWKFRTMVPNAGARLQEILESDPVARQEWETTFKLSYDPRITRFGNFLRRSSLDELPQLFNVLMGDMSLVGPRPIVKDEVAFYGVSLPLVHSARPGITGLWQVTGRSLTTYDHRVRMDVWYIRNWSIWHDLVILMRTVPVVFTRMGAC